MDSRFIIYIMNVYGGGGSISIFVVLSVAGPTTQMAIRFDMMQGVVLSVYSTLVF